VLEAEAQRVAQSDFPRYGAIYDVELDPVVGSETGRRRPALVISNDVNNQYAATVTVLPITGQPAAKQYPFEVLVPAGVGGLTVDSRVKANQVRTVDKARLVRLRGQLPAQYLPEVKKALRIHLNLT
jgi:mRNA interferase MazF